MNKELLKSLEDEEDRKAAMDDVFDLLGETLRNHGPVTDITEDSYMSDLTRQSGNKDEEKFVREQVKLSTVVRRYIVDPKEAFLASHVIMLDVHSIINLSRARGGRVIKAILKFGTSGAADEKETVGALRRIFSPKQKQLTEAET